MAPRKKTSLRLSPDEETLLGDAAELTLLNKTDLVRLAVNRVLGDLYSTIANRTALYAQQFFVKKAEQRWGCAFGSIDFERRPVQTWLAEIRKQDPCATPIEIKNAQLKLDGNDGSFDTAFDSLPRDEIPNIAATRAKNFQAFVNPSESVSLEMMKLIVHAVQADQKPADRAKNKAAAKTAIEEQIRQNYRALIDRYLAIPKLLSTASELGVPKSFTQKYRQDPSALFNSI